MIVIIEHEIGFAVDGIHREVLTKGEYNFDELPLIAQQVCIREEFKIYDPTEVKNDSKNTKKKTK